LVGEPEIYGQQYNHFPVEFYFWDNEILHIAMKTNKYKEIDDLGWW
jgi:hypothetical protein